MRSPLAPHVSRTALSFDLGYKYLALLSIGSIESTITFIYIYTIPQLVAAVYCISTSISVDPNPFRGTWPPKSYPKYSLRRYLDL